jgi:hypothetical protein
MDATFFHLDSQEDSAFQCESNITHVVEMDGDESRGMNGEYIPGTWPNQYVICAHTILSKCIKQSPDLQYNRL